MLFTRRKTRTMERRKQVRMGVPAGHGTGSVSSVGTIDNPSLTM